eukprot:scaffold35376_cov252-Amphora_coffeaeformis.AAC.1
MLCTETYRRFGFLKFCGVAGRWPPLFAGRPWYSDGDSRSNFWWPKNGAATERTDEYYRPRVSIVQSTPRQRKKGKHTRAIYGRARGSSSNTSCCCWVCSAFAVDAIQIKNNNVDETVQTRKPFDPAIRTKFSAGTVSSI